ncbi:MAG: NAD(P)/FAD-dependent oxidoreductase, partial [Flavobacteriales bacterium]
NPAIIGYESCGSWDLLREGQEEIEDDRLAYLNQEIARISGEEAVYLEDYKALHEMGFKGFRTAYKNRSEGALNTGDLMEQLHAICVSLGIHFLFCTEVLSYEHHGNHFMVETNHGCLPTNQLALCTNGFAATLVDLPVQPARAQVLVTNEIDGLKIKGTFHFDCGYYYFRNLGKRLLLGGGRNLDFSGETTMDLSVTETIQNHLIEALKTNIIPSHSFSIDYQWAGIMGIGTEKHPIITQVSPQLFVAVRMGGMGVALGSMAGLTLSKLMLYGR